MRFTRGFIESFQDVCPGDEHYIYSKDVCTLQGCSYIIRMKHFTLLACFLAHSYSEMRSDMRGCTGRGRGGLGQYGG